MIVETVPVGEAYTSPVVAGRIGPETTTEPAATVEASEQAALPQAESAESAPAHEEETTTSQEQSEATATDAPADKEQQEKLFWAEIQLLGRLVTAEDNLIEAETELKGAEEREKDLKAQLSELSQEIPELRSTVEDSRMTVLGISRDIHALMRNKTLPTAPGADGDATGDSAAAASSEPAAPAVDPDGWKRLPTVELLDGVKGLGATKLTDICEMAPTVGDLEKLRAEASQEHLPFKAKLPKGCGQKVADVIEERLVTHYSKWAKQAVGASGKPDTTLADEQVTAIRKMAVEQPWLPKDCEPDEQDTDMIRQGRAAFAEGKPYTALPTHDPELAHQWMVGWVCAEVIAANASNAQTSSSDSQAN